MTLSRFGDHLNTLYQSRFKPVVNYNLTKGTIRAKFCNTVLLTYTYIFSSCAICTVYALTLQNVFNINKYGTRLCVPVVSKMY